MGLSHIFLLGGVDSKSPAFRVLYGQVAFLKDLNMSSLVIPKDASLTCFSMVDINAHLGFQFSASAASLKSVRLERLVNLLRACSSSMAGLSSSPFISGNSHVLTRLAAPARVVRLEGLTLLKSQAFPRRGASYRLWRTKLVEGKFVHLAMPVNRLKVVCEHHVLADVCPGVVYVESATEATRQFPEATQLTKPHDHTKLQPKSNARNQNVPGSDLFETLDDAQARSCCVFKFGLFCGSAESTSQKVS